MNHEGWRHLVDGRRGPGKLQPDRRSLHRRPQRRSTACSCRAPAAATGPRSTARASRAGARARTKTSRKRRPTSRSARPCRWPKRSPTGLRRRPQGPPDRQGSRARRAAPADGLLDAGTYGDRPARLHLQPAGPGREHRLHTLLLLGRGGRPEAQEGQAPRTGRRRRAGGRAAPAPHEPQRQRRGRARAYANFAKSTQMLEKLRHFDGGVYRRLIALDADLQVAGADLPAGCPRASASTTADPRRS